MQGLPKIKNEELNKKVVAAVRQAIIDHLNLSLDVRTLSSKCEVEELNPPGLGIKIFVDVQVTENNKKPPV